MDDPLTKNEIHQPLLPHNLAHYPDPLMVNLYTALFSRTIPEKTMGNPLESEAHNY